MSIKKMSRIYFEDEHCAVVYKRTGENSQTFFSDLFPQKSFVSAVNRLDTPVSGLLLLAFSPRVQAALSKAFAENRITKEYWAVCERFTAAPVDSGFHRLEHTVGFHTKTQKAFVAVSAADSDTEQLKKGKKISLKKAALCWQLCGCGDRYDFIRIIPETGRTHQIRVQMAYIGRPIKGDLKYGSRRSEKAGGIRLHCFAVCLNHPITKHSLIVTAEPQNPDMLWCSCTVACIGNRSPALEAIEQHTFETSAKGAKDPADEKV